MKEGYENDNNKVNHRSFGDILRRMGKYDLMEKMYRCLLNKLPSNDPLLPVCIDHLV
jgi:hypothetical protein